jgi:hypothetical protein
MSNAQLEKSVALSVIALRDIAAQRDCEYADDPINSRPKPCPCAKCVAMHTLETIESGPGNWRYIGAHAGRLLTMPRERKIVESWRSQVGDEVLGMVLAEFDAGRTFRAVPEPSVRDWHVATSVVQWLATNVGMEVLRRAGFEYKGWDEDRIGREACSRGRQ